MGYRLFGRRAVWKNSHQGRTPDWLRGDFAVDLRDSAHFGLFPEIQFAAKDGCAITNPSTSGGKGAYDMTRCRLLLTLSLVVPLVCTTSAPAFNWNNPAGGRFDSALNWTPTGGPPDSNFDTAVFDILAVYDVDFSNNVVNRNLEVTTGSVTFQEFEIKHLSSSRQR